MIRSAAVVRLAATAAAVLALSACATPPRPAPADPRPAPDRPAPVPPAEVPAPKPVRAVVPLDRLPGWAGEDHAAALRAYQSACHAARHDAGRRACDRARALGPVDAAAARAFFEAEFVAEPIDGEGLLTAYFAPEYPARRLPDEIFSAPVRPVPADLVRGPPDSAGRRPWIGADGRAYPARAEIEQTPGQALAFMRPEDLFFLQIQGSGYLTFEDGATVRAAYAADNDRPFVGVARPLAERGHLPRDGASGEAIRAWLAANRGAAAQEIMDLNPRYVFFVLQPDDGREPQGAAGLPLPAGRAIAIDPARHAYGELYWIEAEGGNLAGALRSYRRLALTLDTGGAIRGPVRADLYLGRGEAAGLEAGRVRHPLRKWRLVPREALR